MNEEQFYFKPDAAKVYNSILKRLKNWGLPVCLFLVFFSSYSLEHNRLYDYFKRIELNHLHLFSGIILFLVWCVLVYDFALENLLKRKRIVLADGDKKLVFMPSTLFTKRDWVDLIFYLHLFLLCLFGLLLYAFGSFNIDLIDPYLLIVIHQFLGWMFLSILIVKYYLSITKWVHSLILYLREY